MPERAAWGPSTPPRPFICSVVRGQATARLRRVEDAEGATQFIAGENSTSNASLATEGGYVVGRRPRCPRAFHGQHERRVAGQRDTLALREEALELLLVLGHSIVELALPTSPPSNNRVNLRHFVGNIGQLGCLREGLGCPKMQEFHGPGLTTASDSIVSCVAIK